MLRILTIPVVSRRIPALNPKNIRKITWPAIIKLRRSRRKRWVNLQSNHRALDSRPWIIRQINKVSQEWLIVRMSIIRQSYMRSTRIAKVNRILWLILKDLKRLWMSLPNSSHHRYNYSMEWDFSRKRKITTETVAFFFDFDYKNDKNNLLSFICILLYNYK